MSVNFNQIGHSKAFITNPAEMSSSNQKFLRVTYMQEFIKNQQLVNNKLSKSAINVNSLLQESRTEQTQHFDFIYNQLEKQEAVTTPLLTNLETLQSVYKIICERLDELETLNTHIMEKIQNEGHISQAIIDQLTLQDQSIRELAGRFKSYEGLQETMVSQLDLHIELEEQINEKLQMQEMFHQSLMERISHQEAITEKVSRDLDHLKTVVFERVSYLAEKVEDHFKYMKDYIFNLFSKGGSYKEYSITKPKREKEQSRDPK
jgi:predicted nuclease with TOPRIM domain